MNWKGIINVLSVVLFICGSAVSLAGIVSFLAGDPADIFASFFIYALFLLLISSVVFIFTKGKNDFGTREGFLIVVFGWFTIVSAGAFPFYLLDGMRWVDCLFESASGFSTTGASVIDSGLILRDGTALREGLSSLPKGILFWRSMTHWLGGMGVIVLYIAIMPYLGIGGKKLYQAEVSGASSSQLAPRIADTAKILWGVYISMTVIQIFLLIFGGMPLFDAVCHTFGTIATGGFSTNQSSISAFNSFYIELVIMVFMILGSSNFVLHRMAFKKGLSVYLEDEEFKSNILVTFLCGLALTFIIYGSGITDAAGRIAESDISGSARYAFFQAISIKSTTGYCTSDFDAWPDLARLILLMLMMIGGCAGSTTGGLKHVRIILLAKYSVMQIKRVLFPHSLSNVTLNGARVDSETLHKVLAFFFIYFAVAATGALLLSTQEGNDIFTSVSASVSCLGSIGPAFARLGPMCTYSWMSDFSKYVLMILMLLGRLEIFTFAVVFLPGFWKR